MEIYILIFYHPPFSFPHGSFFFIQIPSNSLYLQYIPFAIMPIYHYFPDSNVFWTYNQSQFFNYSQSDNGPGISIKFTGEKINLVEPKLNLAIE
jgi:hypothetical protein